LNLPMVAPPKLFFDLHLKNHIKNHIPTDGLGTGNYDSFITK